MLENERGRRYVVGARYLIHGNFMQVPRTALALRGVSEIKKETEDEYCGASEEHLPKEVK